MNRPAVRVLVALVAAGAFFSCAGNSIDSLLDEFERLVDDIIEYTHEAAQLSDSSGDSGTVKTLARLAMVQKELLKFQTKAEVIGDKLGRYQDDMTVEQMERLMRIMFKMAEAFE